MSELPYFNKESIFCSAHTKNSDKTNIDNIIKSNNVERKIGAQLEEELKMVNWILNSKALEAFETYS